MNKIKISKNFSLHEFECKDGQHIVKIDEKLLILLEKIREMANAPISITSAYRTKEYNKKCGGAEDSQHLYGMAADITIKGFTPRQISVFAEMCGADGIGLHNKDGTPYTFCHVDVRGEKARW